MKRLTVVFALTGLSVTLLILSTFALAEPGAPLDAVIHIRDANFEAIVRGEINKNDGEIKVSDVLHITGLTLDMCDIEDLTGIEYFINLNSLSCTDNQITEIDLKNNQELEYLYCDRNSLTLLDVSANPALRVLSCNDTSISELNVSHNLALESLSASMNQLTNLDIRNNLALKEVVCNQNMLKELITSNNSDRVH